MEKRSLIGKIAIYAASVLVGMPLLYVASVGPAVYVYTKSVGGNSNHPMARMLDRVYNPLERATDGTPLEAPIRAYCGWWITLAGGEP